MKAQRFALLGLVALGASLSAFGSVQYTCDPTIPADGPVGLCSYLNTTIAGEFNSTFSNVNANIYIEYGTTGLAQVSQVVNGISFTDYVAALTAEATASGDPDQIAAAADLAANDSSVYTGNVGITAALGEALGETDVSGYIPPTTPGDNPTPCTIGVDTPCYNAIATLATPGTTANYWYTGMPGFPPGSIPGGDYDFFSLVEHQTSEILGTSSCVATVPGEQALENTCTFFGANTPSAADLFRCSASNTLQPISALSTDAGQYFSYNGCATTGAAGGIYASTFSEDYAGFTSCGYVQAADPCPGVNPDIENDGGAEINMLNTVGFILATPEPGTFVMLGLGLTGLIAYRRRRRAAVRA
jgi:hypothetical protein